MNETISNMIDRRSCRKYKEDPVPKELLEQVVEAGLYAASGIGKQSPIIIAVTNKELRDKLAESNRKVGGWKEGFDPFYGAPNVLIVLANKAVPTYLYDGSLVMGNVMLAARSLGLATCWIHRAKEEFETEEYQELLKSLGVEGDFEGIGHCVIGYAATNPPAAPARHEGRVFWAE